LDEGDLFLNKNLFSEIKPSIYTFSASYMAVHGRSFFKPLLELWGWKLQCQAFFGVLNPEHNPGLYTVEINQQIF
jgi:hypothetical protein